MRLSDFIQARMKQIMNEWEMFARTLPAAENLDHVALRDHVEEILEFAHADEWQGLSLRLSLEHKLQYLLSLRPEHREQSTREFAPPKNHAPSLPQLSSRGLCSVGYQWLENDSAVLKPSKAQCGHQ